MLPSRKLPGGTPMRLTGGVVSGVERMLLQLDREPKIDAETDGFPADSDRATRAAEAAASWFAPRMRGLYRSARAWASSRESDRLRTGGSAAGSSTSAAAPSADEG